jgi:hypothetical protein
MSRQAFQAAIGAIVNTTDNIKNDHSEIIRKAELFNDIIYGMLNTTMDAAKITQIMSVLEKDMTPLKYAFEQLYEKNIILELLKRCVLSMNISEHDLDLVKAFRPFWNHSNLSNQIRSACISTITSIIITTPRPTSIKKFIEAIGCFELIQDAIIFKRLDLTSVIDNILSNGYTDCFRVLLPYFHYKQQSGTLNRYEITADELVENVILRKDLGKFYEILLEYTTTQENLDASKLNTYRNKFVEGSECHKAFERYIINTFLPACTNSGIKKLQNNTAALTVCVKLDQIIDNLDAEDVDTDEVVDQIENIKKDFTKFTSTAVESLIKIQMDLSQNRNITPALADLVERFKTKYTADIVDAEEVRALRVVTIRSLLSDLEDCALEIDTSLKKYSRATYSEVPTSDIFKAIESLTERLKSLDPYHLGSQVVNIRKAIAEIADSVNSIV